MQLFSHDDKATALGNAPLFKNLARGELVALAKVTEDMEVDDGRVLAREGDIGREFFVIVDGDVVVTKGGEEVNRLGAGDFFGEIALIWESPRRTATVAATGPVRFFVLTRQAFRGLIDHHPDIEEKVLGAIEERVGTTES
jgi:CRP/FNR family cyclic AMP-dependent transcriptional regulator